MKSIVFIFIFVAISFQINAQNQAFYYFDNGFNELTGRYPAMKVFGKQGKFEEEVVEKFGNNKRKVYRFPTDSGLIFEKGKDKEFMSGSYGIEMYFKYDDGKMLLYNQLLGDDLADKQGKYVHLVTTRNQKTKRVLVYIDGKMRFDFVDTQNNMEMDTDSKVFFFAEEGKNTTSGTVSMIKLYDFFIDKESAQELFKAFVESETPKASEVQGVLKNLFFVQSLAIILPESAPELDKIYAYMIGNPTVKIELQGHTDNQGDFDLNLKLSKDRTETVKKYLVAKGIAADRIRTKGFGSTVPIASNVQEFSRIKNRRVELVILK